METSNSHHFIEKRATTRYPAVLFVEFEQGGGWTRDVSATGACIETDQPLVCGAAIRFFLIQTNPQGWDTRVQCNGMVVRMEHTKDGWGIGVLMESVEFEG